MLRGLLVLAVHLLAMPPLALGGTVVALLWPRSEMVGRVAHLWSRLTLAAAGARVTVTGRERLQAHRPAVVVANHTSALDVFLFCSLLPIPFRMVAKKQLFRIPFLGWAIAAAGFVPLERTGGRKDLDRLASVRFDPARGEVIGFYPEGTRRRDGRLGSFKKGAFVTAIREQVPIVPVAIIGARRVLQPGSLRARAGSVEFRVLEAEPTAGLTIADADSLRDRVRARIAQALPPDQLPAQAA